VLGTVDPSVFAFIKELADQIRSGRVHRCDPVRFHSRAVVFCDSFFGQLFSSLGCQVSGFGERSREAVGSFTSRSRDQLPDNADSRLLRVLIVKFEKFCDIHDYIDGNGYGRSRSSVDYGHLHTDYLASLLQAIVEWSGVSPEAQIVSEAARRCRDEYEDAIRETQWLTMPKPSKFDLLRRTLTRRTN